MPLDPVLKGFLDQMAAAPGPPMWEQTPAEGREAFVSLMQLVGPKDVPIGSVENLHAKGPNGDIALRLYAPQRPADAVLPALVYFHGGGFVLGDLDTHDGLCRMFANEAGCRVVAVDYRRSPEHKFPGPVDDAFAALSWVSSHAKQLGIDPRKIAVGGDSAGGALAAVVSQSARDAGSPAIAFQLLLFPVTQIGSDTRSLEQYSSGYFLEKKTLDWFFGHYLPAGAKTEDPRISPLLAKSFQRLPPAFIMLGGFDPLHDEGERYAQALRAAGVDVTLKDYGDMVHCFIYLQEILPQAREAVITASHALKSAFASG